jgi:hypothetical protein
MILSFWSDFYEVSEPTPIKQQLFKSRQTPSDSSVYVLNCLFNGCISSDIGGALYCSTSVTYLLIESSSFFSCKTSGSNCGAIYFYNTNNGQSVFHKVCGNDCFPTCTSRSDGQFSYTTVNNGASSKNYVNYSSISRCVNEKSESYYMLRLINGKICCPSVNISMNKCYRFSGIYYAPFGDSNSITCSSSYSSIVDNIASDCICIRFYTSGANSEIKSCNILRNTQGTLSSWGTFEVSGNLIIEDSCILQNSANYIFCVYGTVTLSYCTTDRTTNSGSLIIQNTVTKSFIHALNHISTRNCISEYDSVGALTPIIQTPSPSKKQIHYTCERLNYQLLQGNFISLQNILVFNFIHYFSSDYPLF